MRRQKQPLDSQTLPSDHSISTSSNKSTPPEDLPHILLAKEALLHLNQGSCPTTPICREKEAQEIKSYIIDSIKMKGSSQTLYIAGMPGIGKTLTVTSVIESLQQEKELRKQFKAYYLNAMNFNQPKYIYKALLYRIFGQHKAARGNELNRLNQCLTREDAKRPVLVVIIDEIDYLMTKDDSVLYNLFEWTQHSNSKLVLIAIANTMNLPQKLKQKTSSRMGDKRLAFRTYNKDEIQKIVLDRLSSTCIFQKESLRYACTKLSTFSCDIRRILFILRRSLEIFMFSNDSKKVQIEHIQTAFNQTVRNRPECVYIRTLPSDHKLILIFMMLESQAPPKQGECTMGGLVYRIRASHPEISYDKAYRVVFQLGEAEILCYKQQVSKHLNQIVIGLNVNISDVKSSIEDTEFADLLNQLRDV